MIKKFFRIILTVISVALILISAMQLFTPIYDFPEPKPFSGSKFHNPYSSLDSTTHFVKVNLHAHQSREGAPLESMYDYRDGEFDSLYSAAGYHLALITDHQYINPASPVRAYEHGYNLQNFHINAFNAEEVWGIDIPFMLNARSQMQWQVNELKEQAEYISINHPSRLRAGFEPEDLSTLRGYDFIEMDHRGGGGPWDIVLSSGYYPMLTATDDSHYPDPNRRFQGRYTMVALDSDGDIWEPLEDGLSYGVELISSDAPRGKGSEPTLRSVTLRGDTLSIDIVEPVRSALFIGQGGVVKQNSESLSYIVQPSDTYIRAELTLENGMVVWLNPIARESALEDYQEAEVNYLFTSLSVLYRLLAIVIFIQFIRRIWKRKKKRGYYTAY